MSKDWNEYLAGGQITPEGREAGLTDDDLVGGQFTAEAIARLEAEAAEPEEEAKAYEDQTVDELKAELKKRDLPVSGTKAELIERLEEDDEAKDDAEAEVEEGAEAEAEEAAAEEAVAEEPEG